MFGFLEPIFNLHYIDSYNLHTKVALRVLTTRSNTNNL